MMQSHVALCALGCAFSATSNTSSQTPLSRSSLPLLSQCCSFSSRIQVFKLFQVNFCVRRDVRVPRHSSHAGIRSCQQGAEAGPCSSLPGAERVPAAPARP